MGIFNIRTHVLLSLESILSSKRIVLIACFLEFTTGGQTKYYQQLSQTFQGDWIGQPLGLVWQQELTKVRLLTLTNSFKHYLASKVKSWAKLRFFFLQKYVLCLWLFGSKRLTPTPICTWCKSKQLFSPALPNSPL